MTEFGPGLERGQHAAVESEPLDAVKDSWFAANFRGVGRFPQTNREGSTLLLAEAVLNDPPESWEAFFDSKLSDNQVRKIGVGMDAHHRREGVRHATAKETGEHKSIRQRVMSFVRREKKYAVTQDRLRESWTGSTEEVGRAFLGYIKGVHYPQQYVLQLRDKREIAAFFSDEQNFDRASTLAQTVKVASSAVMDDVGKRISDNYKVELVANSPTQGRWLYQIRNHVRRRVQAVVPGESMNWLYGKE